MLASAAIVLLRHLAPGELPRVDEIAIDPPVLLFTLAGLMIRTFMAMRDVHPGFTEPATVQTSRIAAPPRLAADARQFARTHESIAERLPWPARAWQPDPSMA